MWELSQRNLVHLVRLESRFEAREATAWNWLDLKLLKEQNRYKELLSDPLLDALTEALKGQKRIIVYHNRKGFAPYIQCGLCGYTTQCLNCDISLTYYKSSQNQRCNYCGYQQSLPKICPGCGGNDFQMKGAGTEKWVDELQTLFPEARIARFDQQSISKRSDFQRIINEFHRGDIDILVGTQLLAKGIDFEDVVHIAVPEGDMPLNNPDFRSNERSFQQYHQLAGRAGRGKEPGSIWIQTYRKDHAVFRALEAGDYESLAAGELESRQAFGYPPFGRLIEVRLRHKEEPNVLQAAIWFNNALRSHFGDRLLGPITPSIARVKNQYIQQFLIKFDAQQHSAAKIKEYLWQQRLRLLQGEGMNALQVDFDVDP
jgi:primosomal protein N' (replication factor Y)